MCWAVGVSLLFPCSTLDKASCVMTEVSIPDTQCHNSLTFLLSSEAGILKSYTSHELMPAFCWHTTLVADVRATLSLRPIVWVAGSSELVMASVFLWWLAFCECRPCAVGVTPASGQCSYTKSGNMCSNCLPCRQGCCSNLAPILGVVNAPASTNSSAPTTSSEEPVTHTSSQSTVGLSDTLVLLALTSASPPLALRASIVWGM